MEQKEYTDFDVDVKLSYLITCGLDENGNIQKKYTLIDKQDYKDILKVNRLVEKTFENIDNEVLRDAFILVALLNYRVIFEKYFSWVNQYVDLRRIKKDNLVSIEVYENIFEENLSIKKRIMINNNLLLEQYYQLRGLIILLHNNRNDYTRCLEIITEIQEYSDLIDMYYPEIYDFIDKIKEENIVNIKLK